MSKLRVCVIAALMLLVIASTASATTFHGDAARTGNFTTNDKILPIVAWKQKLSGLIGATPIYSNGHIYVTNWYGWNNWNPGLYSLNADTGAIEWRNENITGASSVAVYGNLIIVGNLSGHLYYVNVTTGAIEKSLLLETSPSYWGIASSPLIYNNSVYVTTFSNGTLWRLDLEGNILWEYTTGGEIAHYTSPAAYNGLIFFAGNESGIHKLIAIYENRTLAWKFPVEGKITNSPSIGDNKVFIATDKRLYAISLNGNEVWNVSFKGSMSTAAIAYGRVYIGSSDGKLYCFNATTGDELWNFTANGKIDSSPAIANGVVYFATNTPEGTIYAVDAFTGKVLWYYRLKPPEGSYFNIMSSPFIVNGRLYIGADSGYIYCFDSKGRITVNVTLAPINMTITVSDKEYEIRENTALGALIKASKHVSNDNSAEVWFEVTLDDSWYESYGSFFVNSIMGLTTKKVDNNWIYWSIWNETAPLAVGANLYYVKDGEKIYYGYGDGSNLENCSVILEINVSVTPVKIRDVTVNPAKLGGNVTAWVSIGASEDDWYVLVVSGLNENGDYIAGVSTFHPNGEKSLRVPVLLHIHQRNSVGDYKLYAGVYKLSKYPEDVLDVFGPVTCEVSQ